jgi:hypothetical protein
MAELTEDDAACISSVLAAYARQQAAAVTSPPCSPWRELAATTSAGRAVVYEDPELIEEG